MFITLRNVFPVYNSLIQLGVNIELRNAKQWTALDCACAFGFVKPAKALLEAGAAIEPTGKVKVKFSVVKSVGKALKQK